MRSSALRCGQRIATRLLGHLAVDDWLRWRELRNRLAPEYPDQPELRFAVLKAAIGAAGELIAAFAHWRDLLGST